MISVLLTGPVPLVLSIRSIPSASAATCAIRDAACCWRAAPKAALFAAADRLCSFSRNKPSRRATLSSWRAVWLKLSSHSAHAALASRRPFCEAATSASSADIVASVSAVELRLFAAFVASCFPSRLIGVHPAGRPAGAATTLPAVPACLEPTRVPAPCLIFVRARDCDRTVALGEGTLRATVLPDRSWPARTRGVSALHCCGCAADRFGATLALCKNSELSGVNISNAK